MRILIACGSPGRAEGGVAGGDSADPVVLRGQEVDGIANLVRGYPQESTACAQGDACHGLGRVQSVNGGSSLNG